MVQSGRLMGPFSGLTVGRRMRCPVHLPKVFGFAALTIIAIAACGSPAPAGTTAPGVTPAPIGATASPASVPTQATVTTPAPVGGAIDVCSLLTGAEISAATGKSYGEGTLDPVGQCLWNTEGSTGNTGSLVVGYINPAEFSFLKGMFMTGGTELTVGGHAAFYNPTEGLTSLWVDLGGARTFVLSFPQSNDLDPSYHAIAVQLAEIALSRM